MGEGSQESLRAFGIDGESGFPLDSLPVATVLDFARRLLGRPRPLRYGIPSHDLAEAGWGAVFLRGASPQWREAMEPLLRLRKRQAGERFQDLEYFAEETSSDFRQRLRVGHGRVDSRQMPWYLCLVGGPDEIPHGFEMDMDIPCAVGRLAFDEAEDLAAYVERVVAAEEQGHNRPRRILVSAPTHPDDPPSELSAKFLALPLAEQARHRGFDGCTVVGPHASRNRLLEDLAKEAYDLWVFAGHAVQYRPGHELQKSHQGALLCSDWPGPKRWPGGSPETHFLTADDMPDGVLFGGVAVLFGCHTAGTGRFDPYFGSEPEDAQTSAPYPFTAALPQRLLGRRGGALGVLGHVGRTFETSVLWRGVSQIGTFEDTLAALWDGRRLGEALDGFGQRFADLSAAYMRRRAARKELSDQELLEFWIAFHDSQNWCLLGDPAVRVWAESHS